MVLCCQCGRFHAESHHCASAVPDPAHCAVPLVCQRGRGGPSPLYRICLYFAFFRYLAIGRVVKCVEDERLRKLLKAAMWGMLVIIWIYQAYIQGNNAICPYTSEILHIGRETFF